MINLKTGKMDFDGIIITPDKTLYDFQNINNVECNIISRGKGIIYITPTITSNGVDAKIVIEFFEKFSEFKVTIYPIPINSESNIFELSKIWFNGQAIGKYRVYENRVLGKYHWGKLLIKDSSINGVGGEIIINYQKE